MHSQLNFKKPFKTHSNSLLILSKSRKKSKIRRTEEYKRKWQRSKINLGSSKTRKDIKRSVSSADLDNIFWESALKTKEPSASNVELMITVTNNAPKHSIPQLTVSTVAKRVTLLGSAQTTKKVSTSKEDLVSGVVQLDIFLGIVPITQGTKLRLEPSKIPKNFDCCLFL